LQVKTQGNDKRTVKYQKPGAVVSRYFHLLLTNWIIYLALYISFSLSTLVSNFVDHGNVHYTKATTFEVLFSAPVMFTIFWAGYIAIAILFIFITDALFLRRYRKKNIYALTIGQWVISSVILSYVTIHEWGNLVFGFIIITVTLFAQLIRTRKLAVIIGKEEK